MLRSTLLFILMTTQVFAQTECYFDNDFKDGTYGFILKEKEVVLMGPYGKFTHLERNGNELLIKNEIVGQLKSFFPRGIIELGQELSSFKCTVWRHGGKG